MAFSSDGVRTLSTLARGRRGTVVGVSLEDPLRGERLLALGVTPGAKVTMLQTFPGVVFQCDQTELAVEDVVADAILIRPEEVTA